MNLQFKFDFHNVGQGLFHTGKIGDFNFVYDCGSMKKDNVVEAVKYYKNEDLKIEPIDILIISHFDKDHVNGLDKLLSGVKVEYAIIPYYSPSEMLMLAFVKRSYPESYFNFLLNPVSYLLSKGINKVILIKGSEDRYPPDISLDINNKKLLNLEENTANKLIIKNEKEDINQVLKDAYKNKGNHFFDYWNFKFFYHQISPTKLKKLEDCFDTKNISFSSGKELQEYVKNAYSRESIKECYRDFINNDLNFTSLAMYHGPIGSYTRKKYSISHSNQTLSGLFPIPQQSTEKSIGCLLTGDIDIKTKTKYAKFKKYFNNELDRISLFQIPHHGSSSNWNKQILFDLKECNQHIASAGISGRYGHPHPDVISDIFSQQKNFLWAHEYNKISVEGELFYTP